MLLFAVLFLFSNCKKEPVDLPNDDSKDEWVLRSYSEDGQIQQKFFYDEQGRIIEQFNYNERLVHSFYAYSGSNPRPYQRKIYDHCTELLGTQEYEYDAEGRLLRIHSLNFDVQLEVPDEIRYTWGSTDCGPTSITVNNGSSTIVYRYDYNGANCSYTATSEYEDGTIAHQAKVTNSDQQQIIADPTGVLETVYYPAIEEDITYGHTTSYDYIFSDYAPNGKPGRAVVTTNFSTGGTYTASQDFEWVKLNNLSLPETDNAPDFRVYAVEDLQTISRDFVALMQFAGTLIGDNTSYDAFDPLIVENYKIAITGSSSTEFVNEGTFYSSTKTVVLNVEFYGYDFNSLGSVSGKGYISWQEYYEDNEGVIKTEHDFTIGGESGLQAYYTGRVPQPIADFGLWALSTDLTGQHFNVDASLCSGEATQFNY